MAVITLNEAGDLYAALAGGIQGSAVGWSPTALDLLERKLMERYGALLGERAVAELVLLAASPAAA